MARKMFAVLLLLQFQGLSQADNCYDLVDTDCSDVVPFTTCITVACINNNCPGSTYRYGPTSDIFTEFVQPAWEDPYETFTLHDDVNCRYKTLCDTCDEGYCLNSVSPYTDPNHPNVTEELTKPVAEGSDPCWYD